MENRSDVRISSNIFFHNLTMTRESLSEIILAGTPELDALSSRKSTTAHSSELQVLHPGMSRMVFEALHVNISGWSELPVAVI